MNLISIRSPLISQRQLHQQVAPTRGRASGTWWRQAEAGALRQQGLVHVPLPGAGVGQLLLLVPLLPQLLRLLLELGHARLQLGHAGDERERKRRQVEVTALR